MTSSIKGAPERFSAFPSLAPCPRRGMPKPSEGPTSPVAQRSLCWCRRMAAGTCSALSCLLSVGRQTAVEGAAWTMGTPRAHGATSWWLLSVHSAGPLLWLPCVLFYAARPLSSTSSCLHTPVVARCKDLLCFKARRHCLVLPFQPVCSGTGVLMSCWGGEGRDALEGKGPQRRPSRRLDRRLEEVAKAVGGGYCRLQMPLKLALAVRETVAGHRLGIGWLPPPPPSNASLGGASAKSVFLPFHHGPDGNSCQRWEFLHLFSICDLF